MTSALNPSAKASGSFDPAMPKARTLPELLAELAMHQGLDSASIDETGSITFTDLLTRSQKLARGLVHAGVRPGDRIGLLAGNSIDWLTVLFGAGMAGATVVLFSTWATPEELSFLVADADCRLIFATSDFSGRDFSSDLSAIIPDAAARVIAMGETGNSAVRTLRDLMRGGTGHVLRPAAPGDDAMILYTSGSTSYPKGVRLIHADLIVNGWYIGARQGLHRGDRVFVPAPLFWAYGGANALPATLTHGATLVLPQRFDAERALAMIAQHRCTAIYTLPSITTALIQHPEFREQSVESLRTGLTIGSPKDFRQATERLGIPNLCNIYGASETYGNCAVTPCNWSLDRRAECQGTLLPGQQIRFRDQETGALLAAGKTGLAEIHGRVSPGYFGKSIAANDSAFTPDGYYRTGDLGYLDPDGAFVFVGRASEMIKRAGINVSPAEVEDVLLRFEGVTAAAVVGVSDPQRDEAIVAYVTGRDGTVDTDGLRAHCRAFLSKYKLPDHFQIVDRLPLTATGKLQRKLVREMAAALVAADRQGGLE